MAWITAVGQILHRMPMLDITASGQASRSSPVDVVLSFIASWCDVDQQC
jgi:hypothetical protein